MPRRSVAVAVIVLSGLVLAGCGSEDTGGTIAVPDDTTGTSGTSGGAAAKMVQVNAINFAFSPNEIPLTAGENVQFVITNGDQVTHNLTVEGLGVDQDVDAGKTAEAPVTTGLKAGTYKYSSKYHPAQMQGTVTVT